MVEGTLQIG
uniref:Uncharacterized protein n=1 Tax=Oryza meridionalis TaxID=40149 RepID=A0A0G2KBN9_9ORYZ